MRIRIGVRARVRVRVILGLGLGSTRTTSKQTCLNLTQTVTPPSPLQVWSPVWWDMVHPKTTAAMVAVRSATQAP